MHAGDLVQFVLVRAIFIVPQNANRRTKSKKLALLDCRHGQASRAFAAEEFSGVDGDATKHENETFRIFLFPKELEMRLAWRNKRESVPNARRRVLPVDRGDRNNTSGLTQSNTKRCV